MKNEEFYQILDNEFQKIIDNDFDQPLHKRLKKDHQKKSYALLIWFLKFYSEIANITAFITDGDGDHSCDIILDKIDSQGKKIFYLVQSKWNNLKNCNKEFESEVLKSYLSDVNSVLRGDKTRGQNKKFNDRYDALLEHIRANGDVKVLYLTLKNNCLEADENIASLERSIGGNIKVEGFDINQLKLDYIDRHYKKSSPPNPLEHVYNPEYETIKLSIIKDNEFNHIKIDRPFEGHVFNIQPKMIFELVERYGVSLFDKNVRNPLITSAINSEIKNSLLHDPSFFWYYNNGITAISRTIPPINSQAESFEVIGLMIINGAQTAYSIYEAYSKATTAERKIIDAEARITLRLLKSGGRDFDLKVTRFTNSQNPVSDRDFWSHDEIQERIQKYFYSTNIWYSKRAGEFRRTPEGVTAISNVYVANAYLSFWLNDPVSVFEAALKRERQGTDLIFISHKENKEGLYEKIFNKDTCAESMFASFCMFDILTDGVGFEVENVLFSNGLVILAISKIVLSRYLQEKYGEKVNLVNFISKRYQQDDIQILVKCLMYASKLITSEVDAAANEEEGREIIINLMSKRAHFELLIEKIEKKDIVVNDIEALSIKTSKGSTLASLDEKEVEALEEILLH